MATIEEALAAWRESLCRQIPAGGLISRNRVVHKWKAPWRLFLLREAVAWRLVDLLTQSALLHSTQHVLGARILVRSAFETLGMLVYSSQEMRRVVAGELDFHDFSRRTSQLLLGSRDKSSKVQAINIITVLQRADKRYPGLYSCYEGLCESAHPNYEGVLVGYSVESIDSFETNFENRWGALYGESHPDLITACMAVFEPEYNDEWPKAFKALESWIEANDEALEASKPLRK